MSQTLPLPSLSQIIASKQIALAQAKRSKRGSIGKANRALIHAQSAKLRAELNGGKIRVRAYRRMRDAGQDAELAL